MFTFHILKMFFVKFLYSLSCFLVVHRPVIATLAYIVLERESFAYRFEDRTHVEKFSSVDNIEKTYIKPYIIRGFRPDCFCASSVDDCVLPSHCIPFHKATYGTVNVKVGIFPYQVKELYQHAKFRVTAVRLSQANQLAKIHKDFVVYAGWNHCCYVFPKRILVGSPLVLYSDPTQTKVTFKYDNFPSKLKNYWKRTNYVPVKVEYPLQIESHCDSLLYGTSYNNGTHNYFASTDCRYHELLSDGRTLYCFMVTQQTSDCPVVFKKPYDYSKLDTITTEVVVKNKL